MGVDAVVAALMSEAAAGVSEAGKPVAGVPKLDINKGTAGRWPCMPLAAGVRGPLKLIASIIASVDCDLTGI